jgi:hypothetical protein
LNHLPLDWTTLAGIFINMYTVFIIIIFIVAWRKPFSGGIAAAIIGILFIGPPLCERATIEYWTFSYGLPYIIQCLFLFVAGILSVMWGRTLSSSAQKVSDFSSLGRYSWFRWLPRGFLLIAAFMPLLEAIARFYPDLWFLLDIYGYIAEASILLIIAVIAWVAPIAGGVLAILTVAAEIFSFLMDFIPPSVLWASIEWLLLAIGGILSIIWGAMWLRWKHSQARINTEAASK